jgi:hypothetical protein
VPRASDVEPISTPRESAKALSDIVRLLGVFENGLLFAKGMSECDPKSKARLADAVRSGLQHVAACRSRMRELIQNMATSARFLAESIRQDPSHREALLRQAAFYESLLGQPGTLVGTGLEHPFLDKAIAALVEHSSPGHAGRADPAQRSNTNEVSK